MKKRIKQIYLAAGILMAIMTQLTACASWIVVHKPPSETAETAPQDGTDKDSMTSDSTDTSDISNTTEKADKPESDTTEPAASSSSLETAKAALAELRDMDMDGMNYLIAAADHSAAFGDRFDGDAAGSTVLPELRVKRTQLVEEKYNVRILTFSYEAEELYKEIRNAFLSSTQYFADFYAIPQSQVGRYQAEGMIFNLRSLPFTDFSKRYYDKEAMNAFSAGYGIYAAAGDYTFSPENYHAVYFNKTLHDRLSLTSPYQDVDSGTWTWDTFFANSAAARALLDRDGNATYYGDNLSSYTLTEGENLVMASSGTHIVQSGLDRTPELNADTDLIGTLVSVMRKAFQNSETAPASYQYTDTLPDDKSMFAAGKMLYYCSSLLNVRHFADMETVWGLVPLPKANAAQKTYSAYTGDGAVICVPSTVGAPELTGTIMQALFAASGGAYLDAYLNEALSYYVRDGETVDTMEQICKTPYTDFAMSFSSGYSYLNNAAGLGVHSAVTQGASYASIYQNYKSLAALELGNAFGVSQ